MSDLFAARSQMAISLGFHIVFAVCGMAMPLLMVIAEARWLRRGDAMYLELAKRWAKGTAILFAVGAVSGTVLSFELGLLWPHFMERAGPWIGLPFSLEGFAFFLEAIFLGLYLYGWDRPSPRLHFLSGVVIALSGLMSGIFVVAVNAWMNTPVGITTDPNTPVLPFAAFLAPAFPTQAAHMALAAYASVSLAVLGVHAYELRRNPASAFHRAAVQIAFTVFAISVPLQILSGDLSAKHLHQHQPQKLAAAESLFHTTRGAPIAIGGLPSEADRTLRYALEVPKLLSFLASGDFSAEVKGLDAFPEADWPNVTVVHVAFQIMVGCGFAMLGLVGLGLFSARRRGLAESPLFLKLCTLAAPLGLIAIEAGWTVTEVGRQPWIVRGILRTQAAVTPQTGLSLSLVTFIGLYLLLSAIVLLLLWVHVFRARKETA